MHFEKNEIIGIIAAIVCAFFGSFVWVIIGGIGYITTISGVAIFGGAILGYKKFAKELTGKGVLICTIISILFMIFAELTVIANEINEAYEYEPGMLNSYFYAFELLGTPKVLYGLIIDILVGCCFTLIFCSRNLSVFYKRPEEIDERNIQQVDDSQFKRSEENAEENIYQVNNSQPPMARIYGKIKKGNRELLFGAFVALLFGAAIFYMGSSIIEPDTVFTYNYAENGFGATVFSWLGILLLCVFFFCLIYYLFGFYKFKFKRKIHKLNISEDEFFECMENALDIGVLDLGQKYMIYYNNSITKILPYDNYVWAYIDVKTDSVRMGMRVESLKKYRVVFVTRQHKKVEILIDNYQKAEKCMEVLSRVAPHILNGYDTDLEGYFRYDFDEIIRMSDEKREVNP